MTSKKETRWCAIYTRKSSEEGLEQEFNSLDAQREAAAAYIRSQASEGWREVPTQYDDGGFSGGNLERPALIRLLDDIRRRKIRIVVVYKVDRLTRSLSDFAKLIEVFDTNDVSFVSVTQQFNTTTSMGRLMLNVLLSFAQFEREVTGERIRDKIAASKRKGMWMGGVPPIGYDAKERKLVVVEADAEIVRDIYRRYVRLGCISKLASELRTAGVRTRYFTSAAGKTVGGQVFSRGHLHRILTNRIYIGEVVHRDASYPGEHSPIVDLELWDRVQALLAENRTAFDDGKRTPSTSLLKGLIFDDAENRMTPSHTSGEGRRYGYYVSQAVVRNEPEAEGSVRRLPAHDIDRVVARAVLKVLDGHKAPKPGARLQQPPNGERALIRNAIRKVVVARRSITLTIAAPAAIGLAQDGSEIGLDASRDETITLTVPFEFVEKGGVTRIVANEDSSVLFRGPDVSLVKAIARAHVWKKQLLAGEASSLTELASRARVTRPYVGRILKLAFLAPDIVEAILQGRQPPALTVERLRDPIPLDWREQRELFGLRAVG
jgi:DNA invertase Pin-like site-specific DNA recombinase